MDSNVVVGELFEFIAYFFFGEGKLHYYDKRNTNQVPSEALRK